MAVAAAVAIKASAGILVPILIVGVARRSRFALGLLVGFAAATAASLDAFGANLPNLSQQARLVVPTGVPNLLGYAVGAGGETSGLRTALTIVLVVVVAGCAGWALRTRRWLTPCGWVTLALVLTLSWTLPWYVAWVLPFAALARSRGLRIVATVFGVYLFLAWMPYGHSLQDRLHIDPSSTLLG